MKRTSLLFSLAMVLVGALFARVPNVHADSPPLAEDNVLRTINVSGEGRASARPDLAILDLGVFARGTTAREALGQANQAMDRLLAALRANGVAERDIQTTSFSVSPLFGRPAEPEGPPPPIAGYQATEGVRVKVRALESVGTVIDAAAAAAGDNFQMQGLQLGLADPAALERQARVLAMADARTKAEELARLAGVELGEVVSISEGAQPPTPVPVPRAAAGLGMGGTPSEISAGELEAVVFVQVSYAIRAGAPRP